MTITIVDIIPGHPGRRMKIMCLGSRAQMKMAQFITLMSALAVVAHAQVVVATVMGVAITTALVAVAITALVVVAAVLVAEAHAPVVVVGRGVEAHALVVVPVLAGEARALVAAAVLVAAAHAPVVVVGRGVAAPALVAHARPELAQVAAGLAVAPVGRVKEQKGSKKNAPTPHAPEHPAYPKCLKTNAKR